MFKKDLTKIEKEKEDRRKMNTESIKREYEENPVKKFKFELESRPTATKFEKRKDFYEDEFNKKLNFSGTKPQDVPDFDQVEAPVKLTAAAVKREALALK